MTGTIIVTDLGMGIETTDTGQRCKSHLFLATATVNGKSACRPALDPLLAVSLVARAALQLLQLRANVLKTSDGMRWREFVEPLCDGWDVERHWPPQRLLPVGDMGQAG